MEMPLEAAGVCQEVGWAGSQGITRAGQQKVTASWPESAWRKAFSRERYI